VQIDSQRNPRLILFILIVLIWWPGKVFAAPETVSLPVTLDYPFIRSVFVHQLYTAPGGRAIVVDEAEGNCAHIELWNPEVSRDASLIKLGTNIKIKAGVSVLGNCIELVAWEGYIEVLQRLSLDEKNWQVRFETVDSRAYNVSREPATIAGRLWDLIKTYVHPYLNQVSIDLAPPLKELKTFLPLVFSPEERERVTLWLDTLKVGQALVEETAVRVPLTLEVETVAKPQAAPAELSPVEVEQFSRAWEEWDAFLVFQIEALIGQPITESERSSLLETLLETRHGFLRALSRKTIGPDLVREQFIWSWQRLAKVLRKYLVNQKSRSPLSYLAFFTAADALAAMDKLGPTLGLHINREGLLRLAHLLKEGEPNLGYSNQVDPALRKLLGLGAPLDDSGPTSEKQELELPQEPQEEPKPDAPQSWLGDFFFPSASAEEEAPNMLDQVKAWIPPANNPQPYLNNVRTVLEKAAAEVFKANPLPGGHQDLFQLLVLATAWQESCWRQFIAQEGKLRYLLSYNQSSVGLMQVNQRVWRGLYRLESLRWNIAYNARAGCEILDLYLRTYALTQIRPTGSADRDSIARATYAMYNGGPGQLEKFMKRSRANKFYKSDRLFWEKYAASKENDFEQLATCISGV
jgi:hypothetical protein